MPFNPSESDIKREQEMNRLLLLMNRATSKAAKRSLFRKYQKLHQQRPPEYVEALERERGLWRG